MYGQKTRAGQDLPLARPGDDYPIKVHISGIHYREDVGFSVYADVVMDGKKFELRGDQGAGFQFNGSPLKYYKLSLGDYQARLLKNSTKNKLDNAQLFQEYEVVLPDKTVWRCIVTGITE